MRDKLQDQKDILKHLRLMPIISAACARAGVSRATAYRWIADDPRFAEAVKKAMRYGKRYTDDFAFGKLLKKIEQDQLGAITFYLRHRHKDFKSKHVAVAVPTSLPIQSDTKPEEPQPKTSGQQQIRAAREKKKSRHREIRENYKAFGELRELTLNVFPGDSINSELEKAMDGLKRNFVLGNLTSKKEPVINPTRPEENSKR